MHRLYTSNTLRLCALLLSCLMMFCLLIACTDASNQSTDTETESITSKVTEADSVTESNAPVESEVETETATDTEALTQADTQDETTVEEVTDVMHGEVLDVPYAADFSVSNVFSDNMVIQRGEHVRVWGFADASENGKKVSGEFMGITADALIQDGEWVLTFGMRMEACADMGNHMRIYTDSKETVIRDVLVGDVYMVVGQSNIHYDVATNATVYSTTIDETLPLRLHYNSGMQYNEQDYPAAGSIQEVGEIVSSSRWVLPVEENVKSFSALGYYFAANMLEASQGAVPIGLIQISMPGLPLSSFLPNEVADERNADKWNEEQGRYECSAMGATFCSRYMYNCFMNPFERYAMAGLIWYQGESDQALATSRTYLPKFAGLVDFMRSTHNLVNKDFPVYVIELPTIYDGSFDYGVIRSVMGNIPNVVPNSYFITSADLATDATAESHWQLHPHIKHLQAQRLATVAQAVTGQSDRSMEQVYGPILVSAVWGSADHKTVILTYENVGDGLKTCDGAELVKGFIAMRAYSPLPNVTLEARITAPNQITVTASSSRIEYISYHSTAHFFYGVDLNLCNSYGQISPAIAIKITDAA